MVNFLQSVHMQTHFQQTWRALFVPRLEDHDDGRRGRGGHGSPPTSHGGDKRKQEEEAGLPSDSRGEQFDLSATLHMTSFLTTPQNIVGSNALLVHIMSSFDGAASDSRSA